VYSMNDTCIRTPQAEMMRMQAQMQAQMALQQAMLQQQAMQQQQHMHQLMRAHAAQQAGQALPMPPQPHPAHPHLLLLPAPPAQEIPLSPYSGAQAGQNILKTLFSGEHQSDGGGESKSSGARVLTSADVC
jgi:hypothetical protein